MFNQSMNVDIRKIDEDRENCFTMAPSANITAIPSQETHGIMNQSQAFEKNTGTYERVDPSLLSAFKENPFTQSLQSWA